MKFGGVVKQFDLSPSVPFSLLSVCVQGSKWCFGDFLKKKLLHGYSLDWTERQTDRDRDRKAKRKKREKDRER